MRNIIIGTAGHVDHGKTEIVKALTGTNTDRLAEERERGISIVLGFAPLDLGEGVNAGIVDVPGHEKFVKNMVSGAVGVDLALIVVAADEGVMPQTVEHFEVLRLLGVEAAVIAITKMDIADAEIADIVESDVKELLKETPFEDSPFIRTSSVTGEGIEDLRRVLLLQAAKIKTKHDCEYFRMPVDRVFTRTGIGTIVTGTAWRGEVKKGDELVIEPCGTKVRVRDVQNFDKVLGKAKAGTRTALALHGVKTGDISTGNQVFSPGIATRASIVDSILEVSGIKGSRIENRQRVRFHHAAGETLARVILLDREVLDAGEKGFVQLRMESPVVAIGGDRFVLRRYSPMRVLAGGRVIDPVARKSKRFKKEHLSFLGSVSGGSVETVILAVAERSGESGTTDKELRMFGLLDADIKAGVDSLLAEKKVVMIQERLISTDLIEKARERLRDTLSKHITENPLIWGMDREQARAASGIGEGPLFEYILKEGSSEGVIFFKGGKIRTGGDLIDLSDDDRQRLCTLNSSIEKAGLKFPAASDLLSETGDRVKLERYMHILQDDGKIGKLSEERYVSTAVMEDLLKRLERMFEEDRSISIGDFKAAFGLSRKHAVPLLEYLDSEGITVRKGDIRIAGPRLGGGIR